MRLDHVNSSPFNSFSPDGWNVLEMNLPIFLLNLKYINYNGPHAETTGRSPQKMCSELVVSPL